MYFLYIQYKFKLIDSSHLLARWTELAQGGYTSIRPVVDLELICCGCRNSIKIYIKRFHEATITNNRPSDFNCLKAARESGFKFDGSAFLIQYVKKKLGKCHGSCGSLKRSARG